ncbi:hypothetical protein NDU88_005287 [Pleurodeles waltl]|uniref:Uncharacterized protein n=1 Tax=Pleurodeles waltl TaxID=8319 RepID=A0AAV7TTX1_PLEWA|nr:hypothetical protein NDU88_005287 [Pleurodeles waltl]
MRIVAHVNRCDKLPQNSRPWAWEACRTHISQLEKGPKTGLITLLTPTERTDVRSRRCVLGLAAAPSSRARVHAEKRLREAAPPHVLLAACQKQPGNNNTPYHSCGDLVSKA